MYEPRPAADAADSQSRAHAGVPHQSYDFDKVVSTQPEKFKNLIEKVSDNKTLPACQVLKKYSYEQLTF